MKITNSQQAYDKLRRIMLSDVEEFWVMGLKPNKDIIKISCMFKGTVDACLVHPRDIFRFACVTNSSHIIIAHNHPSQDPWPSKEDHRITQQIKQASYMMEVPLLDHIVLAESSYISFADRGWL